MFLPRCRPLLIGSLPLTDHQRAVELILEHTPEIPLWPQLPKHPREGMVRQFLDGFPRLTEKETRYWIDSENPDFSDQMTSFYQDYMEAETAPLLPENSRFCLPAAIAPGFSALLDALAAGHEEMITVKGQVTGPITTGTGVKDGTGTPILYDENLCDILVKLISFKARWQIEQLVPLTAGIPPIIFIDEPGMVSFGSTAFAGVTPELAARSVAEVVETIKSSGGLAGIHICANGDWGPALSSQADIISFDAYSFFDNFILYDQQLTRFLDRDGILAWGIVPTGNPASVSEESAESLYRKWADQLDRLCSLGFERNRVMDRTLISPACGTGSLDKELAVKVLKMTKELSRMIRN